MKRFASSHFLSRAARIKLRAASRSFSDAGTAFSPSLLQEIKNTSMSIPVNHVFMKQSKGIKFTVRKRPLGRRHKIVQWSKEHERGCKMRIDQKKSALRHFII